MAETSARLLRLLSLLQTRRDWTGAELAERLDVAPRTVRRDIDRLRQLGYPVDADRGVAGGYRLGAGAEPPPLLLDDDEAVAIAVGLRSATAGAVNGIEESSVRALAKLEQILPERVRRKVAAIGRFTVALPRSGPAIDSGTLTVLSAACRDRDLLRFSYRAMDGQGTKRKVEPVRLAHSGMRWYLLAWDTGREDWRTFRVDRIESVPSIAGRFARRPEPEGGAEAYLRRMMQSRRGDRDTISAVVRITAPFARVQARLPPAFVQVVDDGAAGAIVHVTSASTDWTAWHLMAASLELGAELQVLEGDELRERCALLGARFAGAAAADPAWPPARTAR